MKSFSRYLLSVAISFAFGLALLSFAEPVAAEKQQVIVRFERQVVMNDTILLGEYVIVHEGALMKEGKPCFFIYTSSKGQPDKLVTSFHCEPIARAKTDKLLVSYHGTGLGIATPIVKEIQFAGDSEAHLISLNHHH